MADTLTIRGDLELLARTEHLFASVGQEFLCAVHDLGTWARLGGARHAAGTWTQDGAQRVRKLCSPAALVMERDRQQLGAVAAKGAQVRITATALPHEAIVIDRRFAILAGRPAPGGREYTVTTGPALVGAIYALFDAAWESATDLKTFLHDEQPRLDAESRAVLRALGSGATDTAAAKQLGMSVRTYRRRVAEILDTLHAGSRFQAGLRAGELGLTG